MKSSEPVRRRIDLLHEKIDAVYRAIQARPMTPEKQEAQSKIEGLRKEIHAAYRRYRIVRVICIMYIAGAICSLAGLVISIFLAVTYHMLPHPWLAASSIISVPSSFHSLRKLSQIASGKRMTPRPPLRLLNAIVKALWSLKTYDQVFKPVVADIVYEWKDARRRRERFRAWWIEHIRGPYAIIQVALLQLPWSTIKKVASVVFKLSE